MSEEENASEEESLGDKMFNLRMHLFSEYYHEMLMCLSGGKRENVHHLPKEVVAALVGAAAQLTTSHLQPV